MGVVVSEKPCWVRRETRRSWDKRPDWGRPGTVLRTSQKRKGLPWVTEERKETKFCGWGGKWKTHADRLRRGKNGTKIVIDNVDGGHEGVGGDNGMDENVDSGKGGCVGPYFIIYVYLVSSYRPAHSPLCKSMHLVPLLLHHPLKVSGGFRGTHNREKTLEGDQELYQLLLISKRSLLAMRPANGGGEGERRPCPVEV